MVFWTPLYGTLDFFYSALDFLCSALDTNFCCDVSSRGTVSGCSYFVLNSNVVSSSREAV